MTRSAFGVGVVLVSALACASGEVPPATGEAPSRPAPAAPSAPPDVPVELQVITQQPLALPWSAAVTTEQEPAWAGGVPDDVVRGFFVSPESPIQVEVIGRFEPAPGVPAYVYRTNYLDVGAQLWNVKYWDAAKRDWVVVAVGEFARDANKVTARAPTITAGLLEGDEWVQTTDDAGNSLGFEHVAVTWTWEGAGYVEKRTEVPVF